MVEDSRACNEDWPSTLKGIGGFKVDWQLHQCSRMHNTRKKVEEEDQLEELKMADGTVVKTEG